MVKYINVRIKNYRREKNVPLGTKLSELTAEDDDTNYIAAIVNNEITSLSYSIEVHCTIEFITNENPYGMEVYKRSLSFLLAKAIKHIFPDKRFVIGHSFGQGYYFDLEGVDLDETKVQAIEDQMVLQVQQDLPIIRDKIGYTEALEIFKKHRREDKYKLLSALNMSKIAIYRSEDFFQVFAGAMAVRTGFLNVFSLIYYKPGFILQFPDKKNPAKVADFKDDKKIFEIYRESKDWGRILQVDNVGALNDIIIKRKIRDFIQVSEALHEKKIIGLAQDIYSRKDSVRVITIAGPSSSGKTTFSKRLSIQLKTLGLKPVTISVDSYFVDREKTPLDENGDYDFESIYAIDIKLFNDHLTRLINGEKVHLADFDFKQGKSLISSVETELKPDEILVMEGIHCLNDQLTFSIEKDRKYKIYISALTQMNIDDSNRIPTTDNRVIRRMVRDYKYRGHSALETLRMWPSVRRGESTNIFPFQNEADGHFNSALDYELAVLKPYAQSLLQQIKPSDKEYAKAQQLLTFLSYFLSIPPDEVPGTSLLREFIGGSAFKY